MLGGGEEKHEGTEGHKETKKRRGQEIELDEESHRVRGSTTKQAIFMTLILCGSSCQALKFFTKLTKLKLP